MQIQVTLCCMCAYIQWAEFPSHFRSDSYLSSQSRTKAPNCSVLSAANRACQHYSAIRSLVPRHPIFCARLAALSKNRVWTSLVPRHQIFRARPAALSKNRVWTRSLVKLGLNHTSVVACCRTNQIAQVCVITNSQLANFLAAKQTLLVPGNVINTYNYSNLLTAVCKHAPVFVVKVSRPYFSTRPQGAREKLDVWGRD